MKTLTFLISVIMIHSSAMFAQVSINNDGAIPDNSAMLDVKSTSKGFLPPRMTMLQIGSISNPANGLIVFSTDNNKYYGYISSSNSWKEISFGIGTITPGTCGTLTINHFAGDVAPVNKTVTYGTVMNIPGEPSKCWITSNLGANHQAANVSDSTEASAGWYWQFNRKQGYKDDSITRTPNTIWVSSINENSDWLSANDPCTSELGIGWRIPTYTEWNNVDASGNWTSWNGPWNSGLKLHAAGWLDNSYGSLSNCGSTGYYWSNSQHDTSHGWYLVFSSNFSIIMNGYKAYGCTLRCLRAN